MDKTSIALSSALFGAFITGFFNFFMKIYFDRRTEKRQEQRLAYAYMARVAEFISAKRAVFIICKTLKESLCQDDLNAKSKNTHSLEDMVCVFLANAAKKSFAEEKIANGLVGVSVYFDELINNFNNLYIFEISTDIISKLPKETIIRYYKYSSSMRNVLSSIKVMKLGIEQKDCNCFKSSNIYEYWKCLKDASSDAENLLNALVIYGEISKKDVAKIMSENIKMNIERFKSNYMDNIRLKAVEESFEVEQPEWAKSVMKND